MVYSDGIEDKIDLIIEELKKKYPDLTNCRWHAIKLLEQDKEITKRYPVNLPDVIDRNYESDIINEKYDFIQEIIKEVLITVMVQKEVADWERFAPSCSRMVSYPFSKFIMKEWAEAILAAASTSSSVASNRP